MQQMELMIKNQLESTMSKCQLQLVQYAEQILLYSGRSLFFKGNYQDCIDHDSLKYALVQFGAGGQDIGAYTGICIPRSCNDTAIAQNVNKILAGLNSTLGIYSIDSKVQDYHVQMDWLSYLTIVIISGLVAITLWSTLKNLIFKDKKSNKIIEAFDIGKNMTHFKIRENEDLNIFDGVRALSMMWVVIGHSFSFYLSAGLINMSDITVVLNKPFYLIIEAGLLAVDVFLLLAGFFLAFVYLRETNKSITGIGFGILQRALRIWPAFIICMMFYDSLFMQLGSGLFWSKTYADVSMCRSMWREILFVANLIDRGQQLCLGWSWYLQVDFQLFIISLLLLFVYHHSRLISIGLATLFSIGTVIFNIVFTYDHQVALFTDLSAFANFGDFMLDLYMKPWGRSTPYLMGLILGILYTQYRKAKKEKAPRQEMLLGRAELLFKNKYIRIGCEWFGFGLMALVAFLPRNLQTGSHWSQLAMSFYWGFSKPVFLFGLILTILPSTLGFSHSFFNLILTPKIFHFIARISFCTYLVHLMILYQFIFTRNYNIYFNLIDTFQAYMGMLMLSLFFGFLLTVIVELPFAKLQRQLMKSLKARSQAKQQNRNELKQKLINSQNIQTNESTYNINRSVNAQE